MKTKIGFSPKSFYKTSSKSQTAKISQLISDANNSFSVKSNRSKCDLNTKLKQDKKHACIKKVASDSSRQRKRVNNLVSKQTPISSNKGVSHIRNEKISTNSKLRSFSETIVKECERRSKNVKSNNVPDTDNASGYSEDLPNPQYLSRKNYSSNNLGENKSLGNVKHNGKRRASEADLIEIRSAKHAKLKTHKRSKSSSSRRRNDIKHILTNYQNRLIQQRHQDHQAIESPTKHVSPVRNTMCNIIKPAKLTNVTPTKLPPAPVPFQVQQTIVKSTNSRSIIMLSPNPQNTPGVFPTQIQNTTYNKQMIIIPAPNTMSGQLPALYHHQSEVRTSFTTSNIIVPSAPTAAKLTPTSGRNNPFLPPTSVKSSFLFGNNDDFETADNDDLALDDEVILAMGSESSSDDSDGEDDDHIIYSPIHDDGLIVEEDKILPNRKMSSSSNPDKNLISKQLMKTSNSIEQKDCNKMNRDSKTDNCLNKSLEESSSLNLPTKQSGCENLFLSSEGALKPTDTKAESHTSQLASVKNREVDPKQKIRFPAVQGPTNMIECKWLDCQMSFTTYGRLSDHLKVRHSITKFGMKKRSLHNYFNQVR